MQKFSNKKIAAIVPAFNEEKSVGQVLKIILDSQIFDQVIAVDDGSTDQTSEAARRAGAEVLRLEKNLGKGQAMAKGVESADAEIVAFFDADLLGLEKEHILALVQPMVDEGLAMCVGVRGRLWNLPRLIAKIDPVLAIGGERAVRKDVFEAINKKYMQGFAVEPSMNYYCRLNKFPVRQVMLENLDVITKEQKRGFFKGFSARLKMSWQIASVRLSLAFFKNEFIQKNNIGQRP